MAEPPQKRHRASSPTVTAHGFNLAHPLSFRMMLAYSMQIPLAAVTEFTKAQKQLFEAVQNLVQGCTEDELNWYSWRANPWFCWVKRELWLLQPNNAKTVRKLVHLLKLLQLQRQTRVLSSSMTHQYLTRHHDVLIDWYGDGCDSVMSSGSSSTEETMGTICSEGLRWMLTFISEHQLVLFGDLGSGYGTLLGAAATAGYRIAGIECASDFYGTHRELFKTMRIPFDSTRLAYGDMLEWEPVQEPGLWFCNNHNFSSRGAEIMTWAATTILSGSYVVTLAPLPVQNGYQTRQSKLAVSTAAQSELAFRTGAKVITLVGIVTDFTKVSWNSSQDDFKKVGEKGANEKGCKMNIYRAYVYQIHDVGVDAVMFGTVPGFLHSSI
jgi:hypothetical protein